MTLFRRILTYRLTFYYLAALVLAEVALAWLGIVRPLPLNLAFSLVVALASCFAANEIFARVFGAKSNWESVSISAMILTLIVTPAAPMDYTAIGFLVFACAWAMASKYILATSKKHIFNPAAFGVALAGLLLKGSVSWWVGDNSTILPLIVLGGILVLTRLHYYELVISFTAGGAGPDPGQQSHRQGRHLADQHDDPLRLLLFPVRHADRAAHRPPGPLAPDRLWRIGRAALRARHPSRQLLFHPGSGAADRQHFHLPVQSPAVATLDGGFWHQGPSVAGQGGLTFRCSGVAQKIVPSMNTVTIRALEPSEWEAFRDFRLASLQAAPGVFAMTHDTAAHWSPDDWQAEAQGPDHQVFGLFDGKRLIGITAAFTWRGDPAGQTALLAMSYILPAYRGRGFSRLFYDARLAWIRAQPQFRHILVSHRKSNEASRRANQRHGFSRPVRPIPGPMGKPRMKYSTRWKFPVKTPVQFAADFVAIFLFALGALAFCCRRLGRRGTSPPPAPGYSPDAPSSMRIWTTLSVGDRRAAGRHAVLLQQVGHHAGGALRVQFAGIIHRHGAVDAVDQVRHRLGLPVGHEVRAFQRRNLVIALQGAAMAFGAILLEQRLALVGLRGGIDPAPGPSAARLAHTAGSCRPAGQPRSEQR